MKNTFLTGLFIAVSIIIVFDTQAQPGVKVGLNYSNVHRVNNHEQLKSDMKVGFLAGANFSLPIAGNLLIRPGISFAMKGFTNGAAIKMDAQVCYVEIPVDFLYKMAINKSSLVFGAGPYMGYGLGGQWKTPQMNRRGSWGDIWAAMDGNIEFTNGASHDDYNSVIFGSTYTYARPFDYGVNLNLGYEFPKSFSVEATGQIGIANIAPKVDGKVTGDTNRNYGFSISVGYRF